MSRDMEMHRVILWTTPRCCSSVFERSIRELPTVKCLYEPHMLPFYKEYHEHNDPKMKTYEFAEQQLLANYDGYSYLFSKDMAGHVPIEQFSKFTEGRFSDFKHSFIIRNPKKSIPSRWKACTNSGCAYTCNSTEYSYSRLFDSFQFIRSTGREVTVVDADDLLKSPEYIMEQYCCQTGLPYDRKMLKWTPGEVKDWTVSEFYKEWHWNAMYSSGFGTVPAARDTSSSPASMIELPDFAKEIEESMPYYEAMCEYRIKLPK